MRVLVAVASRHGATREIADEIRTVLEAEGLDASVADVSPTMPLAGYDAVVLGSGVYAGHWLAPAKRFAAANRVPLRELPVWLFSSGPLGDPSEPEKDPVDVDAIDDQLSPIDHRVFAGKLDRSGLGFTERAIVGALGVADGDYRPWDEIRDWAEGIAAHVSQLAAIVG